MAYMYSNKNTKRRKAMAEINVVPYIDVMLVLLIIFMVTAPMLTQGVNVHLPEAQAKSLTQQSEPPIIVSVDNQGFYYLNTASDPHASILAADLLAQVSSLLNQAKENHKHREVYVKGDQEVSYGKVVQAMALLQKAGAAHVGLITIPPAENE